jgi:ribonuclease VapC
MVIDTSALIAILLDEPERRDCNEKIEADPKRLLSAASFVETALVIESRSGEAGGRELDLLLFRADVQIVPVDADQAEIARRAFRQYGRGNHPAGLNFGDCFAYALVKTTGEPLLFKGDDFAQTDVMPA